MSKQEKEATKKSPTIRCGCAANHQPATECDAIICSCGNAPHLDGFATVAWKDQGQRDTLKVVEPTPEDWNGLIQCGSCGAVFNQIGGFVCSAPICEEEEEEGTPMTEKKAVAMLIDLFDNEEAVRESDLGEALARKPARSFKEAGVLTHDSGIILRLKDGRSIYLTVQIQNGRL